jgi:hypothetical protein
MVADKMVPNLWPGHHPDTVTQRMINIGARFPGQQPGVFGDPAGLPGPHLTGEYATPQPGAAGSADPTRQRSTPGPDNARPLRRRPAAAFDIPRPSARHDSARSAQQLRGTRRRQLVTRLEHTFTLKEHTDKSEAATRRRAGSTRSCSIGEAQH